MDSESGGGLWPVGAVLGCPWRTRELGLSVAVGTALIVVGVSATAALCWLVLHLLGRKPLVATHVLLLQLCGSALVCSLLAGYPFVGTSAIAGHWLFGAKGCVALAVIQHMGVVLQMWTLAGLAMERWLSARPADPLRRVVRPLPPAPRGPPPPPPGHWYARALALPWIVGAAVAAPPLLGWGSFGCDVTGVCCAVKWSGEGAQRGEDLGEDVVVQDTNSFSYALFAVLAGRLVPATVTVWCLCGTGAVLSTPRTPRPARPASRAGHRHHAVPSTEQAEDAEEHVARLPDSRLTTSLTMVARLAAAGILLLRLPRLLLDLHMAAAGVSWDRAPPPLTYVAPVADEASALVLPLVCVVVERRLRLRCRVVGRRAVSATQ